MTRQTVHKQLILVGIGDVRDLGRYRRRDRHNQVHSMLMSWASHILVMQGSSEGQGYTIVLLDVTGGGLPPHSLIPRGVEYTTPEDIAIGEWLQQASRKIRENTQKKYLEHKPISKDQHYWILKSACKWLYG